MMFPDGIEIFRQPAVAGRLLHVRRSSDILKCVTKSAFARMATCTVAGLLALTGHAQPQTSPSLPTVDPVPGCHDPMQWAVAEGKKPVYNNRIFAKAFPYFIQFVGVSDDSGDLARQIDQSLQNALTQWGASLLAGRSQLEPALKTYVESMLLCSGGRCQYTAPPAVLMTCPQNAAMVIIVYKGARFPAAQEWVAGMAKREGRTILLNASDFSVVYNQLLFSTWSETGDLNLTPVLAHELGHSFGLSHSGKRGSIMAADLSAKDVRRFVAPVDGMEFANVLKKSVDGGIPGDFNLDECQGLYVGRPPSRARQIVCLSQCTAPGRSRGTRKRTTECDGDGSRHQALLKVRCGVVRMLIAVVHFHIGWPTLRIGRVKKAGLSQRKEIAFGYQISPALNGDRHLYRDRRMTAVKGS
jgi:hypothetical protein